MTTASARRVGSEREGAEAPQRPRRGPWGLSRTRPGAEEPLRPGNGLPVGFGGTYYFAPARPWAYRATVPPSDRAGRARRRPIGGPGHRGASVGGPPVIRGGKVAGPPAPGRPPP